MHQNSNFVAGCRSLALSLTYLLLFVTVYFTVNLVLRIVAPYWANNDNLTLVVSMALTVFAYTRVYKSQTKQMIELVRTNKCNIKDFSVIVAAGVALNLVFIGVLSLLREMPIVADYLRSTADTLSNENLILSIIIIAIVSPIFEEIMFRGYIQTELRKGFTATVAIIVQALIFGTLHLNIIQSAYTFFLGISLGFVALRFNSLIAPILFHIAFNSANLFVNVIMGRWHS